MRTVTLLSQKGGSGKTTLSINLAIAGAVRQRLGGIIRPEPGLAEVRSDRREDFHLYEGGCLDRVHHRSACRECQRGRGRDAGDRGLRARTRQDLNDRAPDGGLEDRARDAETTVADLSLDKEMLQDA